MADPTDPAAGLPDPAVLEQIKQILSQIYEIGQRIVTKGAEGAQAFASLDSAGGKVSSTIKDMDVKADAFFKRLTEGAVDAEDVLQKLGETTLGLDLKLINVGELKSQTADAFRALSNSVRSGSVEINKLIANNRINLAEAVVFDFTGDMLRGILKSSGLSELESKLTEPIQKIGPAIAQMAGGSESGLLNTGKYIELIEESLVNVARSAQETGISVEASRAEFSNLAQAGLTVEEILKGMGQTIDSEGKSMDGLTAAMRISSATGLGMAKVGEYVRQNIRQLGRSATDTGNIFAALSLAQQKTKLSMSEVSKTVMDSATTTRFYGTNVESLAATFNSFISSVGEGRQELGKELFTNSIAQIEKMNFGMKAFLGMQSGIGKGGGAIGAGLEVEQALSEGRTGEIFESIRQQLEKFGGGQVLTRKEAIDTGQQTQYLMQRQLLSTITNEGDAGKLEAMMGIIQRREIERAPEIFGQGAIEKRKAGMLETGQTRMDLETGVGAQAVNRLMAKQAEAIGKMVSTYGGAANSIRDVTNDLVDQFRKIGTGLIGAIAPSAAPVDAQGLPVDRELRDSIQSGAESEIESTDRGTSRTTRHFVASQSMPFATRGFLQEGDAGLQIPSRQQVSGAPSLFQSKYQLAIDPAIAAMAGAAGVIPPPSPTMPPSPGVQIPTTPAPLTPAQATSPGVTPAPSVTGAPTTGQQTLNFEAAPVDIPLIFKVEGDSLRIAFASMENKIIASIKQVVV